MTGVDDAPRTSALTCPQQAVGIAEPYLTDLKKLADQWMAVEDRVGVLECRHFFSGAAVYLDE